MRTNSVLTPCKQGAVLSRYSSCLAMRTNSVLTSQSLGKQRAVHCVFAEPLLYDNLATTTSGMLDEADLRVNLLADLRGVADHAYLAALGGL